MKDPISIPDPIRDQVETLNPEPWCVLVLLPFCVRLWLRVGQLCTLVKEDGPIPQKDFEEQI